MPNDEPTKAEFLDAVKTAIDGLRAYEFDAEKLGHAADRLDHLAALISRMPATADGYLRVEGEVFAWHRGREAWQLYDAVDAVAEGVMSQCYTTEAAAKAAKGGGA